MCVSGDSEGFVRLFRYPVTASTAEFVERRATTGAVASARFLFDDIYVVAAVGGGGKNSQPALVRWKIK